MWLADIADNLRRALVGEQKKALMETIGAFNVKKPECPSLCVGVTIH
jgi:hypothetical protein